MNYHHFPVPKSDKAIPAARAAVTFRFKVLVNGFRDGSSFASIQEAREAIAARNADDLSFEIYDAVAKRYVWNANAGRLTDLIQALSNARFQREAEK